MERALLPAELQSALLARAGGNPLYAEEFARMAEGRTAADLARVELPESVQGIIAARLDGLDPADKSLLQDAAVIGKAFWVGAVAAIGGRDGDDIERRLHELERGRFVRRARRSSVGTEAEYAFLHLLLRDVAYGQIPRAARAAKHRAAAEWIASLGANRLEDRAELLAHHYLSALELARAAGAETAALEGPARLALRSAGERAIGLGAFAAAERSYAAAVELWPADDPERPLLLFDYGVALWLHRDEGAEVLSEARDLLLAAGDVERAAVAELYVGDTIWRRGRGKEAQEHFDRAASLVAGRAPSRYVGQAKAHLARYLMVTGRSLDAIAVGREAMQVAEVLDDDELRTFALNSVGISRVLLGDVAGLRDVEESIAIAERANLPWHVTRGNANLAVSLFQMGDIRRTLEIHRHNLAYAERFAIAGAILWNKAEIAFDLGLLGEWDEALAIADAELARMEAGASHYLEVQHRNTRAKIRVARGDLDGALADADRGVEVGRTAGDPQTVHPALAERARVLLVMGRLGEAEIAIDEVLRTVDPRQGGEWAWWIVAAAIVLTEVGRANEILALGGEGSPSRWVAAARSWAAGDLPGAAAIFEEIGAAPDEAYARLCEARHLIAEDRRPDARPQLDRVIELSRQMGATSYLREAESLIETPEERPAGA